MLPPDIEGKLEVQPLLSQIFSDMNGRRYQAELVFSRVVDDSLLVVATDFRCFSPRDIFILIVS